MTFKKFPILVRNNVPNAVTLLLQSYNNNFYANDDVEED